MTRHWAHDAIVYHVYPLGLCGAPARNDRRSAPTPRLAQLADWIEHWRSLGTNTLYLGPLFESVSHGYDTTDYFRVDRRLGDNATLAELTRKLHAAGIRVLLDGVLNHVGRDFWAFRDVVRHGQASPYASWFSGMRFDQRSPCGDPFTYDSWAGHYELVKLDLSHPDVRRHLLDAVSFWIREFDIDGLRLDAADVMDLDFLRTLAAHCRALKPDFWLMGEVVHGDYTRWANPQTLDATTNYWAYKSLWSSHNDRNYFEIAHSLERQFGPGGVYRDLPLYSFVDNHDVDRIGSQLSHRPHLFPLHVLLFTMPGVPSIYYGSEWAIEGRKTRTSDAPLRPALKPRPIADHPLASTIARLSKVRAGLAPLRHGTYRHLHVANQQFAFMREAGGDRVVVAVNAADTPAELTIPVPGVREGRLVDVLNGEETFPVRHGKARITPLYPSWGRVMVLK
jgi:glycosidase